MDGFTYTQLEKSERLSKVQARIAAVERQHFDLALRVEAPDLEAPPNEMNARNLETLAKSLGTLRALEQELS